jgi:hypothetical protein
MIKYDVFLAMMNRIAINNEKSGEISSANKIKLHTLGSKYCPVPYVFNDDLAGALSKCRAKISMIDAVKSLVEDNQFRIINVRFGIKLWISIAIHRHDNGYLWTNGKTSLALIDSICINNKHKEGMAGYITSAEFFGRDYDDWSDPFDMLIDDGVTENDLKSFDDKYINKTISNIVLYLASGAPDLRHYTPPDRSTGTRRERDRLTHEFGTEPAIFVSWGWKKPAIHHVDSCEVSGHWRLQPHGVERKLLKLIWIDNYVKTFNKQGFIS